MPHIRVNGVSLRHQIDGQEGPAIVFVHGSWGNLESWDRVVPGLAQRFRVVRYDRRGHSGSERVASPGSAREDALDLAALIEALDLAPVVVAGNSFGAVITLRLACERPDLMAGLFVHEPPALGLLGDDPATAPMVADVRARVAAVVAVIASGDHVAAAKQFVETVALGPGEWERLPDPLKQVFIENAPTYLDEQADPDWFKLPLEQLGRYAGPAHVSQGDQSPPFLPRIADRVAAAIPHAERHTFAGAGHVPHLTHADAYVARLTAFATRANGGSG